MDFSYGSDRDLDSRISMTSRSHPHEHQIWLPHLETIYCPAAILTVFSLSPLKYMHIAPSTGIDTKQFLCDGFLSSSSWRVHLTKLTLNSLPTKNNNYLTTATFLDLIALQAPMLQELSASNHFQGDGTEVWQ
jgi:hypothetical protein